MLRHTQKRGINTGHLFFNPHLRICFLKEILFIYFLERGEGREKKKERNIDVPEKHPLVAHTSRWEPGLQPRYVPCLGIKPVIFRLAGQCSIYWASPAKRSMFLLIVCRERGMWGRERERKRNTDMRNIDRLRPIHALTGDWTLNTLVYGTWLQPTEQPRQGHRPPFKGNSVTSNISPGGLWCLWFGG